MAALRWRGETEGRVRRASGPERMGSSPCWTFLFLLVATFHACRDKPCVNAGSLTSPEDSAATVNAPAAAAGCLVEALEAVKFGSQNSTTRSAEAKIPVCTVTILVSFPTLLSADPSLAKSSSTFRSARANSLRTAIHSVALRLLCWNMTIRGLECKRDWYWRWS